MDNLLAGICIGTGLTNFVWILATCFKRTEKEKERAEAVSELGRHGSGLD